MKKKARCPKCGGHGFIAKWNDCSAWSEYCFECNGTGEVEVPFTRGDRIRSMSDKELAEFISSFPINTLCDIVCDGNCKAVATLEKDSDEVCEEIVQKWLKEEWY